jgi:hypothetical protein
MVYCYYYIDIEVLILEIFLNHFEVDMNWDTIMNDLLHSGWNLSENLEGSNEESDLLEPIQRKFGSGNWMYAFFVLRRLVKLWKNRFMVEEDKETKSTRWP